MFDLSTHDLSDIFWKRLLRLSAWEILDVVEDARRHGAHCETLTAAMDVKTGSIPLATAAWLTMLTRFAKIKQCFEIGTYVGKSAAAIALGMDGGRVVTCDANNSHPGLQMVDAHIEFKRRTTSTDALDACADPFDLFFFDGRIQDADIAHIERLSHERTIYAFDDFEGVEKGVTNVALIRKGHHALIYPPAPELLQPFGVADRSTLALLIPAHMFRVTAQ